MDRDQIKNEGKNITTSPNQGRNATQNQEALEFEVSLPIYTGGSKSNHTKGKGSDQ